MLRIRGLLDEDWAAVWSILGPTIRAGETYALPRQLSEAEAREYWTGGDRTAFVAEKNGRIVGTYYIRPNQPGGGSHVANCGYMTEAASAGQGVARQMCEHSLEYARGAGFLAMQFNFVISSNERAVRLWQFLGFEIVGRLPAAFRTPSGGYDDALVMFKTL
jgi:ribosomal protein S18 acetylase RimI-like enzyme